MTNNKVVGRPKKDFSNLMKSKYVEKWLKRVNSIQHRLLLLDRFCKFIKKTPDELIQEHHQDLQLDPIEQTEIAKKQLNAYFGYLTQNEDNRFQNEINNKIKSKKVKWNSARQYVYSKILSFYNRNNVPVNFNKGEMPEERKDKATKKIWKQNGNIILREGKKEVLKSIYDVMNSVRNRAILLCKISSGLDDVDLFNLKYGDFTNGYFDDYNVCYIDGHRAKTKVYFQTFFSSEACDALFTYFKYREKHKEEHITRNSWLFVGSKKINGEFTKMKSGLFYDDLKDVCNIWQELNNYFPNKVISSIKRAIAHRYERNQLLNLIYKPERGLYRHVKYMKDNKIIKKSKRDDKKYKFLGIIKEKLKL